MAHPGTQLEISRSSVGIPIERVAKLVIAAGHVDANLAMDIAGDFGHASWCLLVLNGACLLVLIGACGPGDCRVAMGGTWWHPWWGPLR